MHWVEVRDPKRALGWSHDADPAWLRYDDPATALPDGWLHYGDPRMDP
jgi:hypothetical protein